MELSKGDDMWPSEPENNKSLDVAEQRTGFVIIPFNYDQLPESQQRKMIVPICIAAVDRHGNPIAPIWFEKGVAPVQEQLRRIAQSMLGDIRRVSELAETTIHRLWERHGQDAGRRPSRRVLKRAMWVARDLAAGANWWQIERTVSLALDSLEGDLNGPNGCEEMYQQQLLLDLVERRIEQDQRPEIRDAFKMLRQGYTWDEVAERLGDTNPEALKRRFWRWMKRNLSRKRNKSASSKKAIEP